MREPPKLTAPMAGDEAQAYLTRFCHEMQDTVAWIKGAVERIEAGYATWDELRQQQEQQP